MGLVSLGGTGRDDISMQLALRIFGHVGFIHQYTYINVLKSARKKRRKENLNKKYVY